MKPGSKWRFKVGDAVERLIAEDIHIAGDGPVFDELAVDKWFHLEQMDEDLWWMSIGSHVLWVRVGDDGEAIDVSYYPPGEWDGAEDWERKKKGNDDGGRDR